MQYIGPPDHARPGPELAWLGPEAHMPRDIETAKAPPYFFTLPVCCTSKSLSLNLFLGWLALAAMLVMTVSPSWVVGDSILDTIPCFARAATLPDTASTCQCRCPSSVDARMPDELTLEIRSNLACESSGCVVLCQAAVTHNFTSRNETDNLRHCGGDTPGRSSIDFNRLEATCAPAAPAPPPPSPPWFIRSPPSFPGWGRRLEKVRDFLGISNFLLSSLLVCNIVHSVWIGIFHRVIDGPPLMGP